MATQDGKQASTATPAHAGLTLWSQVGLGLLLATLYEALMARPMVPAPGAPALLALATPLLIGAWFALRMDSPARARWAPVLAAMLAAVLLALVV